MKRYDISTCNRYLYDNVLDKQEALKIKNAVRKFLYDCYVNGYYHITERYAYQYYDYKNNLNMDQINICINYIKRMTAEDIHKAVMVQKKTILRNKKYWQEVKDSPEYKAKREMKKETIKKTKATWYQLNKKDKNNNE